VEVKVDKLCKQKENPPIKTAPNGRNGQKMDGGGAHEPTVAKHKNHRGGPFATAGAKRGNSPKN